MLLSPKSNIFGVKCVYCAFSSNQLVAQAPPAPDPSKEAPPDPFEKLYLGGDATNSDLVELWTAEDVLGVSTLLDTFSVVSTSHFLS